MFPDSKIHGATMGHIWGRQDPAGPHVGPMDLAIWVNMLDILASQSSLIIYACL